MKYKYELTKVVEELGTGEILLKCDGQGKRFDINLIKLFSDAMSIPVIASIGAGIAQHCSHVFQKKKASMPDAGIFLKKEED
ncbi:unnamed protein product [Lactuca virosa]|uniref:Uncharacterized protein n=1 Tax=Lactuca virosa TaxID=75947 RepID=A0AAU9P6N4_9ASTR|nr:unnamed protein product [Lactuca virosa]